MVCDTGLCGVGDEEPEVGVVCLCDECIVFRIGIDTACNGSDLSELFHGLAVLNASEDCRIKSVLSVDHVAETSVEGLYEHYVAVEVTLLVELVDNPVNKCAKEVAFTELKDLNRSFHCLYHVFDIIHRFLLRNSCNP